MTCQRCLFRGIPGPSATTTSEIHPSLSQWECAPSSASAHGLAMAGENGPRAPERMALKSNNASSPTRRPVEVSNACRLPSHSASRPHTSHKPRQSAARSPSVQSAKAAAAVHTKIFPLFSNNRKYKLPKLLSQRNSPTPRRTSQPVAGMAPTTVAATEPADLLQSRQQSTENTRKLR